MTPCLLTGENRERAADTLKAHHYAHSVPSGKSYYVACGDAIVVWSIPANKNLAKFVLGWPGKVWELSRLWAPDGHDRNLLTQAISKALGVLRQAESVDAVVSYADPNVGHEGHVYRAASWTAHGQSEEARVYRDASGQSIARRAFHSGGKSLRKAEIEALGYTEHKLPGKLRYVRLLSRRAKRLARQNALLDEVCQPAYACVDPFADVVQSAGQRAHPHDYAGSTPAVRSNHTEEA